MSGPSNGGVKRKRPTLYAACAGGGISIVSFGLMLVMFRIYRIDYEKIYSTLGYTFLIGGFLGLGIAGLSPAIGALLSGNQTASTSNRFSAPVGERGSLPRFDVTTPGDAVIHSAGAPGTAETHELARDLPAFRAPAILAGAGLISIVVGFLLGTATAILGLVVGIGLLISAFVVLLRVLGDRGASLPPLRAQPVGRTPDGQPICPVVGYTPDGQPVTADRAVGYRAVNPKTNTLAIVTLVVSLVVSVAAIPIGHIALIQIKNRGEQGRGLAIAGLVLGYLGLAGLVVIGAVLISNM